MGGENSQRESMILPLREKKPALEWKVLYLKRMCDCNWKEKNTFIVLILEKMIMYEKMCNYLKNSHHYITKCNIKELRQ